MRILFSVLTPTQERPAVPGTPRTPTAVRTDIQGLRAIAVSMVLLYHLWPNRMSGGFTGVDVFFVISGFLITSHLLAHPPRTPRDLLTFWSRRIRRLLPASLLVLLTTLVATRLFAPDTAWANTATQIKAAALYVVNWRLADDSVDYLASQNAPTPVQHFWSLSVEEQFYLVWPVLILLLVLIARLVHTQALPIVFVGLAAVVVVSLVYSVHLTATDPARAYFVTPTRMWELGVGGLLATLLSSRALGRRRESEAVPLAPAGRVVLAWAGLAAMAFTAFRYTGATPFPGWQAAVPVLGAAAVIAACAPTTPGSPGQLMAWRPVQFLGDISYSVYLWHWPIVVIVPLYTAHALTSVQKVAIIVVSLVLATLTKRYVEDRFRTPQWGRPLLKPYLLGAIAMAVVVSGALLQTHEVNDRAAQAAAATKRALSSGGQCLGAAALAAPAGTCPPTTHGPVVPTPLQAAKDKSDAYHAVSGEKECFAGQPSYPVISCTRGDTSASVNVALVGNSHAGQWLPALERLAGVYHWKITTYLASQCALADVPQSFADPKVSAACARWVSQVTDKVVHGNFDLVVMTNKISVTATGHTKADSLAAYQSGYQKVLERFAAARQTVVGIHDTPAPGTIVVPDCLAAHPDDFTPCNGTRSQWIFGEPMDGAVAAVHDPAITEIDLNNYICESETCPAAVGGVVVYFDNSHLTATYAKTLAPYLGTKLRAALAR